MQEVFEKIKQRIMIAATEACGYAPLTRAVAESELKDIMESNHCRRVQQWLDSMQRRTSTTTERKSRV